MRSAGPWCALVGRDVVRRSGPPGVEGPVRRPSRADLGPWGGEWVAFPYPLLTPRARMIAPNAWLASVLESMLLAYVQIERRGLEAFRPLEGAASVGG